MGKSIELTVRSPPHEKRLSASDRLVLDTANGAVSSPDPEDLDSGGDLYGTGTQALVDKVVESEIESANQLIADVVGSVPLPADEFDSFEEESSEDTGNQTSPLDAHTTEHSNDISDEFGDSSEENESRPIGKGASALLDQVVNSSLGTFIPDPKAFTDEEVVDGSIQESLADESGSQIHTSTRNLVAHTIAQVMPDDELVEKVSTLISQPREQTGEDLHDSGLVTPEGTGNCT